MDPDTSHCGLFSNTRMTCSKKGTFAREEGHLERERQHLDVQREDGVAKCQKVFCLNFSKNNHPPTEKSSSENRT